VIDENQHFKVVAGIVEIDRQLVSVDFMLKAMFDGRNAGTKGDGFSAILRPAVSFAEKLMRRAVLNDHMVHTRWCIRMLVRSTGR